MSGLRELKKLSVFFAMDIGAHVLEKMKNRASEV